eukprot:CCRYP_012616-RA/>CCRYP_012616-RA protein AED:0.27 eAED:0.31 QI:0/0/0/1/1/1/2/0/419
MSREYNPCVSVGDNSFKLKPGTNCKEYVQCFAGEVATEFTCQGDTLYDETGQFCNWPDKVDCDEMGLARSTSSPMDTGMKTTVTASEDSHNPCFGSVSGFRVVPRTNCKKYVQCYAGEIYSSELQCEGDTIFYEARGYCDWITSVTCEPTPSVETSTPTTRTVSTNKPSPKPLASTKRPSPGPTVTPTSIAPSIPPTSAKNSRSLAPTESNSINATPQYVIVDCSNPCPSGVMGFQVRPNTKCTKYVQCNDGTVVQEFQCPSGTMFFEETGGCRTVDESVFIDDDIWSVHGTNLCPDVICSDYSSTLSTIYSSSSSSTDPPVSVPTVPVTNHQTTMEPTFRQPATKPVSINENFRKYLYQRQEMFDAIVFQSLYGPSVEYTFDDLMNSLNVVVFNFPFPWHSTSEKVRTWLGSTMALSI